MRRIVALCLVSIVILSISLTGYAAPKATTLTFWTFVEFHAKFMQDAVATWNKANPNNQIVLKPEVYGYDEMHNKLLIALQSGVGAPDLVDIELNKFSNYLKGKTPQLVPLNSIVNPVLNKCIKSRFDIYAKDGKYYGVDYHVGSTIMYYNKEILDKAGVDVDKIVTWNDYVEAGKKVVATTGKSMTTVEVTHIAPYYYLLLQYGSEIFDKNGKVILDNNDNAKVLSFIKDWLYKDKIAIPAPGGAHSTEEFWGFMNKGGVASLIYPIWFMGRFVQYMPDLKGKILIRPLPVWKKGGIRSVGMGGTGTAITVQCKNKDLAMKFLAHAKLSREGAIKTWTILGFDPIRWDVWDDPAMRIENDFTNYFVNGKEIFTVLREIKDSIIGPVMTEKYPLAIDLLRKVCFKVLQEQSATPEQALKEAADELRKS